MARIIITFITLLSFSMCFGQYDWREGKIILKDGQTLKGFVKLSMSTGELISLKKSKVLYKKNRKGKVKRFNDKEINKVFYGSTNSEIGYFEYVPITKNKLELLRLVVNGKSKLYKRVVKSTNYNNRLFTPSPNTNFNNTPNHNRQVKTELVDQYYVIRSNEIKVTQISIGSTEKFKEKAIDYFKDCKKIVKYLENNLYEEFDIHQLIEDYNIFCE
ncbi:hypothetical protein ATE84_0867 [Aquimarina sp. MAR_2010_214]|uniref:hypothetical protein n=1 Tax=Aquimarina sp. MAR_2010_214 TaxID=1250026 RepID=UPI000C70A958|nr:hypothetical protein [Aquimarina sp. MAR_2010_214]PKV48853.1 hypothetical protein ATE84_0867 [Aquimarina sp. MAR_2010_214]